MEPSRYGAIEGPPLFRRYTREEALAELKELNLIDDAGKTEQVHFCADAVLIGLINDPEITEAFEAIYKWYA